MVANFLNIKINKMNKKVYFLPIIFLAILFANTGCSGDNPKHKKTIEDVKANINESESLINFLEQSGNIISEKRIPTLISADKVKANLSKFFVIDIRKHKDYVAGHIDGAVNVEVKNLVDYMKTQVPAGTYEKVVLVCYSGHKASFATMGLQLLGYKNVYSMKWGMSSWDKNVAAKKWLKHPSDKYSSKLEKNSNPKGAKTKLPEIKTGKTVAYDILEERVKAIFNKLDFKIGIDKLMENPSDYYIINYWPDYNYNKGHLPGAIQYDPKLSLLKNSDLLTLPTDKKVLVYDYTGQHASFVAAYLQILGYDAYTLTYGANSFMHSKLTSLKIGHAFNSSQVKNYPMVEGELPSIKKEGSSSAEPEEDNSTPVIIKKKAMKEEEGGC